MTDTNTKPNLSFPVILLHLFFITVAFMLFNPLINLYPSPQNNDQFSLYFSLLTIEVCTIFFIFPFRRTLKVSMFAFILIILCSVFNLFDVFLTILSIIRDMTPAPHTPYLEIFFEYISILDYLPLPTYLAGYINKKLFWTIASITIAGFAFFFIWNFMLSRFF